MSDQQEPKPVSFKETLNLPHTDFPLRPNAKVDDPELLARWETENIYTKTFEHNSGSTKYIVHDGPPYANGNIHLGHAYNKVLKDIVAKYHRMSGKQAPCTPGWDCHGLPIEKKVTEQYPNANPTELKKACRIYAQSWIDVQRQEFKRLGILMDWDRPYLTMNPHYEATVLRVFGKTVSDGFIEHKNKTVPWCPTDQTVLATAEIEYKDRKDPSIYVLFDFVSSDANILAPELKDTPVSIVVWTTTPWTLPLNRAVMLNPQETYELWQYNNRYFMVGTHALPSVLKKLEGVPVHVKTFTAENLRGMHLQHPFDADRTIPIIFDDNVALTEGTGAVHTAPGAGPIDYEVGIINHLEIFSPITPDGKYTDQIKPNDLIGMSIQDGQGWVIKQLLERDKLLFKASITHSYPHCWRCHNGLIFRATPQWFLDLSHENIKQQAINAIETKIEFSPARGRSSLKATVDNRLEWCLSRQRIWGIPIPALLCKQCDYAYINQDFIERVAQGVEKHGIEYWDTVAISDLISNDILCPHCKTHNFKKETDILDVWFDAGVSHYAVLYNNPELAFPANVYIEGVDQYRGWFQSSLLTSLVIEHEPSMKHIVTHGFTVDAKGQKMSKSIGNVVAPQTIIDQLGTDGLRLWAANIDLEKDAIVSDVLLRNISQVYQKVRNTARFLLSNLYDFNKNTDALPLDQLLLIDRFALERLFEMQQHIFECYENFDTTAVAHELADYCTTELSAFYLDIIKDRLYVEKADGRLRRSAQTTCWYILDTLTRLMAPILSFTAERISDSYQKDKTASIHLQPFADLTEIKNMLVNRLEKPMLGDLPGYGGDEKNEPRATLAKMLGIGKNNVQWLALKTMRDAVLKALEGLRVQETIKHSLEAQVFLYIDPSNKKLEPIHEFFADCVASGQTPESFLKEFFIVSRVTLEKTTTDLAPSITEGIFINVDKAPGTKCPRCWNWEVTNDKDGLDKRCQDVLDR